MRTSAVKEMYYNWLCDFVDDTGDYNKLLSRLFNAQFEWLVPLDENRAVDGTDLRYRFGREMHIPDPIVEGIIGVDACSVLEMMVALALRCEEKIMTNTDLGNRTSTWFWMMIRNLGMEKMDDRHFDQETVDQMISRFINREYEPDGRGGLIYIPNTRYDLRKVEIWDQLMWYLSKTYES